MVYSSGMRLGFHAIPRVAVGILEITGIAAPEIFPGRLDDFRAGFGRLFHDRIDLFPAPHIVADAELASGRDRISTAPAS